MAISYYDFKNLTNQSQYELVIIQGKVISETSTDMLKFVLYEMSSFCVEVVYQISTDKLAGISAFQKKIGSE
ncbi:hypothetical protein PQ459_14280 [Chryseobacterium sp. KACC 21268]|nr:hypothetical protein PQ459_14280 [Chryseobacterium sp. KACC 21268]